MSIKQIFSIQKFYVGFDIFAFSLLLPFLLDRFSPEQILACFTMIYVAGTPFILFAKMIYTRRLLMFAFLFAGLSTFIYVLRPHMGWLVTYFTLIGLTVFFYYVPYNIRYFNFSNRLNRASSAGIYIIVGPVLNTFIPLIAAGVIMLWGHWGLVIISLLIIFHLIARAAMLPSLAIKYDFADAWKKSKGMKSLKFVQGLWEISWRVIPLYVLAGGFVSGGWYASYLSLLGLAGAVATLILTRYSDKSQKRMKFFGPLLMVLSALTFSLFIADSVIWVIIITAMISIVQTLIYPFFMAVVLDKIKDKEAGLVIREFLLNMGRVTGILICVILLRFGLSFNYVFLFMGIAPLIYLIILTVKKTYIEEAYDPLGPVTYIYGKGTYLAAKVYSWGKVVQFKRFNPGKIMVRYFDGKKWSYRKRLDKVTRKKFD